MEKSKYYYDKDRNKGDIDYKEDSTPPYYIGKYFKYKAKDIIYDFNLSYNLGTAISYILRSGKKSEKGYSLDSKGIEDLIKAINHLNFEIDEKSRGGGK
mgnify:CR=1 FL=1|tara:strand:- start:23 stop:319 length:297 start_codon:yes stop_codon:yes gene_type:complete